MRPVLAILVVLLAPGSAQAGALKDVVGGLQRASDNDDDPPSRNASKDAERQSDAGLSTADGGGQAMSSRAAVRVLAGLGPPPPDAAGMHASFYAAGQSVHDSDGAFTLEGRAWYEDFGLGVRQTTFFEKDPP